MLELESRLLHTFNTPSLLLNNFNCEAFSNESNTLHFTHPAAGGTHRPTNIQEYEFAALNASLVAMVSTDQVRFY